MLRTFEHSDEFANHKDRLINQHDCALITLICSLICICMPSLFLVKFKEIIWRGLYIFSSKFIPSRSSKSQFFFFLLVECISYADLDYSSENLFPIIYLSSVNLFSVKLFFAICFSESRLVLF